MGLSACGLVGCSMSKLLPVPFPATSANDVAAWRLTLRKFAFHRWLLQIPILLSRGRVHHFVNCSPAPRAGDQVPSPIRFGLRSQPPSGDHTTHDHLQLKRIIMVSPPTLKSDTFLIGVCSIFWLSFN